MRCIGKTTLLNWFRAGYQSQPTERPSSESKHLITNQTSLHCDTIHHNCSLVDTPGFGDTEGLERDITNVAAIVHTLEQTPRVVTILFVDYPSLGTINGTKIEELIQFINEATGNLNSLHVLMKAPLDEDMTSALDDALNQLRVATTLVKTLSDQILKLLATISSSVGLIVGSVAGCLHMPLATPFLGAMACLGAQLIQRVYVYLTSPPWLNEGNETPYAMEGTATLAQLTLLKQLTSHPWHFNECPQQPIFQPHQCKWWNLTVSF